MKQVDLFYDGPMCRRDDPITSFESAEIITESGDRATQQHIVLAAVKMNPGHTSRELAQIMRWDNDIVHKRLPELKHAGLVQKGDKRLCRVSKRYPAYTWYPKERE